MGRRVLLIGLDCAPPALLFERYHAELPNLARLMAQGQWGPMRSTVPPITVPAWTSMLSGRDPGELGLYGFRNREADGYGLRLADSRDVHVSRVWDWAGDAGKQVCVLFVPPTHPPPAVNGELVSCFLTPDTDTVHTHPDALADELEDRFGPYRIDVDNFRGGDPDAVLASIHAMTEQHFAIARHMWRTRRPELMVMVEMGPDRLHHAFWQHMDPSHPQHDPSHRLRNAGRDYYRFLDARMGELLAETDDETTVLVVSDHGARAMQGGICLNEWLIEQGELTLHSYPETVTAPAQLDIDWARTRVWSEGGYYARVFLNLEGREPQGCVAPADRERLVESLRERIGAIPGPDGAPLQHRILTPRQAYRASQGRPPDLLVFLGDLDYRAVGSVGGGQLHVESNDTGTDGANHDWDGVFVMAGGGAPRRGQQPGFAIYDVAATIAGLLGLKPEADLLGTDRSR